jgi:hypothetical protein
LALSAREKNLHIDLVRVGVCFAMLVHACHLHMDHTFSKGSRRQDEPLRDA